MVLASCSSDDATSIEEILPMTVHLTKTIETDQDGSLTTVYTYDGNKIKETIDSDGYKMVFTYTGDLITRAVEYDDEGAIYGDDVYVYNAQGQLIQNFYSSEGYKDKYDYTHNADGTISVAKYTTAHNSDVYVLSYNGKIFSNKVEEYVAAIAGSPAFTATHTFTYDDKNNPMVNITGFDKLAFLGDRSATNYTNNVIKEVYTTSTNLNQPMSTSVYSYTDANFPATSVETYVDNGETVSTQYFY